MGSENKIAKLYLKHSEAVLTAISEKFDKPDTKLNSALDKFTIEYRRMGRYLLSGDITIENDRDYAISMFKSMRDYVLEIDKLKGPDANHRLIEKLKRTKL